jgi:hypothetical protein
MMVGAALPGTDFTYFAFVNYTTLGYGDVTPRTGQYGLDLDIARRCDPQGADEGENHDQANKVSEIRLHRIQHAFERKLRSL